MHAAPIQYSLRYTKAPNKLVRETGLRPGMEKGRRKKSKKREK
jgi:hypothetical protein